jgi:hypothetical protein
LLRAGRRGGRSHDPEIGVNGIENVKKEDETRGRMPTLEAH